MSGLLDVDYLYEYLFGRRDANMSENNASDSLLVPGDLEANVAASGTLAAVASLVDQSVAPAIVIAGLLGNIIALFVFSERSMQRRSSNVYLVVRSCRRCSRMSSVSK